MQLSIKKDYLGIEEKYLMELDYIFCAATIVRYYQNELPGYFDLLAFLESKYFHCRTKLLSLYDEMYADDAETRNEKKSGIRVHHFCRNF